MKELTVKDVKNLISVFKKEIIESYSSNNKNVKSTINNLCKAYNLLEIMINNNFEKNKKEPQFVKADLSFNAYYDRKVLFFIDNKFYLEDKDTYFKNTKFKTIITKEQVEKDLHLLLNDLKIDNKDYDESIIISGKITNCYRLLNIMKNEGKNYLNSNDSFIAINSGEFCMIISSKIICIDKRLELYLRDDIDFVSSGGCIGNFLAVRNLNTTQFNSYPDMSDFSSEINKFLLSYHNN